MDLTTILGTVVALGAGKAVKSGTKRITAPSGDDRGLQRGTVPAAVAAVSAAAAMLGADAAATTQQILVDAGTMYTAATTIHSTGKNLLQLLGIIK